MDEIRDFRQLVWEWCVLTGLMGVRFSACRDELERVRCIAPPGPTALKRTR